jgi:shikimate dehydrogenase
VIYALQQLGVGNIVVYNRTAERAAKLVASAGGGSSLTVCPTLDAVPECKLVVSTLPASVGFTLPDQLLAAKPVVFDVNYNPAETNLMAQAKAFGCAVIGGIEMLIDQGLKQNELWTLLDAPADIVRPAVYKFREETL